MKSLTEKLIHEVETLPPPMQQEVVHFVEFLKQKLARSQSIEDTGEQEPTGTKLARLMEQVAARGTAFSEIEDPAEWQREIRKDRPLPGRELV